jgi:GTP cyclohydrolase II
MNTLNQEPGRVDRPGSSSPACVRTKVEVPLLLDDHIFEAATMVTFDGLCDGREHLAVLFGDPLVQLDPLVRLHSECLTGDVFGSARCDCGPQLRESVRLICAAGGIILYLRHEGRGIGLYNKLDAYRLQDFGFDTFAANNALGFVDDLRDYQVAAQMLKALGVTTIRLLSNNPDKTAQLCSYGIDVHSQQTTGVFITRVNLGYLEAKVLQAGHHLKLD